jgi:hypothetical protein
LLIALRSEAFSEGAMIVEWLKGYGWNADETDNGLLREWIEKRSQLDETDFLTGDC